MPPPLCAEGHSEPEGSWQSLGGPPAQQNPQQRGPAPLSPPGHAGPFCWELFSRGRVVAARVGGGRSAPCPSVPLCHPPAAFMSLGNFLQHRDPSPPPPRRHSKVSRAFCPRPRPAVHQQGASKGRPRSSDCPLAAGAGRQSNRQKEIFHPLDCCQTGTPSGSPVSPSTGTLTRCLPRCLSRELDPQQGSRDWNGRSDGACGCPRRWFNSLCHHAWPSPLSLGRLPGPSGNRLPSCGLQASGKLQSPGPQIWVSWQLLHPPPRRCPGSRHPQPHSAPCAQSYGADCAPTCTHFPAPRCSPPAPIQVHSSPRTAPVPPPQPGGPLIFKPLVTLDSTGGSLLWDRHEGIRMALATSCLQSQAHVLCSALDRTLALRGAHMQPVTHSHQRHSATLTHGCPPSDTPPPAVCPT
nr:uncharacterized protein LOC127488739 [Oryctolagus cuniculus]